MDAIVGRLAFSSVSVQPPWRVGWCRSAVQKSQKRWWGQRRAAAAEWGDRGGCRSGRCPPRGSFCFSHPEARRCKQTRPGLEKQSRQLKDYWLCPSPAATFYPSCVGTVQVLVSHPFHTAELGLGMISKRHSTAPLNTTQLWQKDSSDS